MRKKVKRSNFILSLLRACVVVMVAGGLHAVAQSPMFTGNNRGGDVEKAQKQGDEDIARLLEVLKDDQKRQRLIHRLESAQGTGAQADNEKAMQNPEPMSGPVWGDLASASREAANAIEQTFSSVPALLALASRISFSLLLLVAGYVVWRLVRRYLLPRVRSGWPVKALSLVILGFAVVVSVLNTWGVDIYSVSTTTPGQKLIRSGATIIFVVLGAYVIWEVMNHILSRHVARVQLSKAWDRRLQTVLPLVRNALLVVICVITGLVVLSEVGINIAPLLAGAGIAGLAIGFGAQTLVKDLLTGFFVLLENTINIGDWVILGGHDGQVEGLTIRHVTVRDIYGNLHTVPWSSVVSITNQTRKFGYAVVEVGFAYRENIDEVVSVVKQVAEEMRQDPAVNQDILSELQVLGLIELGDSAVVVRTRFQTSPFMRWRLERDFRHRIKNRFDELGIEIPYPHQTVYFGQDKQGQAPPARVQIRKVNEPEESESKEGQ